MKRSHGIAAIVGALVSAAISIPVAAGGGTTTVHRPPTLGPPRGEAADPQPVVKAFKPVRGNPEKVVYRAASGCGVERWAVKTGTDPGAAAVNLTPQASSIADIASIQPPASPTDRVTPFETSTFSLTGVHVDAIKQEADSDYHLAISDGLGNTMIAESPSTSCDSGSLFGGQIATVRAAIDSACPGIGGTYHDTPGLTADLTGVGFMDRIHGQRGVAPNGAELHPLTAITLHGQC